MGASSWNERGEREIRLQLVPGRVQRGSPGTLEGSEAVSDRYRRRTEAAMDRKRRLGIGAKLCEGGLQAAGAEDDRGTHLAEFGCVLQCAGETELESAPEAHAEERARIE